MTEIENLKPKRDYFKIASWCFGVSFAILSIGAYVSSFISGSILLLVGFYLIPPINLKIKNTTGFNPSRILTVVISTILFFVSVLVSPTTAKKNEPIIQNNEVVATTSPKVEAPKEETQAIEKAKKEARIAQIGKMTSDELDKLDPYNLNDWEMQAYRNRSTVLAAKKELENNTFVAKYEKNIKVSSSDSLIVIQNDNDIPVTIDYIDINKGAISGNRNYYISTGNKTEIKKKSKMIFNLKDFADFETETYKFNPNTMRVNDIDVNGSIYVDGKGYDIKLSYNV